MWPAGMVLANYMLTHHSEDLKDKSVMEIGAGGGLVGLAVASRCQTKGKLVITDQEVMLSLMQKNITLNRLEDKVVAAIYDWGTSKATSETDDDCPDVVLAADCVYFEPAFPLLLQTLGDLVGPQTRCYFCFKKRRKADMRFIRDMQKNFDCSLVVYEGRGADQINGIHLFEVRRKVAR